MPILRKKSKESASSSSGPFLEIQYHPSDIRSGVRYFFFTRRQYLAVLGGFGAFALFLLLALLVTPGVVTNQRAKRHFQQEMQERAVQGERLKALVQELDHLAETTDEVRTRMSKIYLVYGFSEEDSRGQGGYPHEPAKVPQSIYAATIRQGNGLHAKINEQFGVLKAFLSEVQSFETDHADLVRTTPSLIPVTGTDFVLTSPFGNRTSPFTQQLDFHAGIDLAAPIGTPIVAPGSGVVAFAGRYPLRQNVGWYRYGNMVAIRHGQDFITLYGHCDEVKVRSGQRVEQGQVIATVGDTGMSTNPHLHYEIRRLGEDGQLKPVDPRIYILNHRWRDEERLLIRARQAPDASEYEPLPRRFRP